MSSKNKGKLSSSVAYNFKADMVSKIGKALKVKYKNLFWSSGYKDTELYSDIDKFLTTKYQSKLPKDAFKPIESMVLSTVREKRKALNKSDGKIEVQKNSNELNSNLKSKTIEASKGKSPNQLNDSKGIINNNNKELFQSLTTEPRTLKEELMLKMQNDEQAKFLKLDALRLQEEEKQRKIKKSEEQAKISKELMMQIEEKEKLKQLHKEEEKKFLIEQQKLQKQWEEEENERKLKKQKQIQEYQKTIDDYNNSQKNKNVKQPSFYDFAFGSANNPNLEKEKQRKFKEQLDKFNEENKEKKKQMEEQRKEEYLRILKQQKEMNNRGSSENIFQRRVQERIRNQEIAEAYLSKIMEARKDKAFYYLKDTLKDFNQQENANEVERKKKMVEDMRKSLDECILSKQKEKEKKKEDEKKYLLINNQVYNDYLNEESERKKKKIAQMAKYREELQKQIEDNKKRNLDNFINSFDIKSSSRRKKVENRYGEEVENYIMNNVNN